MGRRQPERQTVRLSTKGQIVLPQAVRERLRLEAGDVLLLEADDHHVVLKTPRQYVRELRGIAGGVFGKTREEIDAYVRDVRGGWRERERRLDAQIRQAKGGTKRRQTGRPR